MRTRASQRFTGKALDTPPSLRAVGGKKRKVNSNHSPSRGNKQSHTTRIPDSPPGTSLESITKSLEKSSVKKRTPVHQEEEEEEEAEEQEQQGEKSNTSPPSARQLDFTGEDEEEEEEKDEEEERTHSTAPTTTPSKPPKKRAKKIPSSAQKTLEESQYIQKGRRVVVFWSPEEEEFLRGKVAKYGEGSWKRILIEGKDIFHPHRTNVDLKDKWKNLQKVAQLGLKRRNFAHLAGARDDSDSSSSSPKKRATKSKIQAKTTPSEAKRTQDTPTRAPSSRKSAQIAASGIVAVHIAERNDQSQDFGLEREEEEEEEEVPVPVPETLPVPAPVAPVEAARQARSASVISSKAAPIVLKIATDHSFPELVQLEVELSTCPLISNLKELLKQKGFVQGLKASTLVEIITIKTRRRLRDHQELDQCIAKEGNELYVVVP